MPSAKFWEGETLSSGVTPPSDARKVCRKRAVFYAVRHRETEFEICGVKFSIDLLSAQKTGFYLDQIPHYPVVAGFAAGRRVLDCFTNEGAFALTCARAGASEVIGVEMQASAIAAARENQNAIS